RNAEGMLDAVALTLVPELLRVRSKDLSGMELKGVNTALRGIEPSRLMLEPTVEGLRTVKGLEKLPDAELGRLVKQIKLYQRVVAELRAAEEVAKGADRVPSELLAQGDGPGCFPAGTSLLTPQGSKRIEEFRPGDLILSRAETEPSGVVEAKEVQEV